MSDAPNELAESEDFEFAALERAVNYRAAVLREFSPWLTGDVLEIGAGVGQFTGALKALPGVRRVVCLEPELRFVEPLRKKYPGTTVIEGTIEDLDEVIEWDGMVSINVLEHIRDDAGELAKYAVRLSKRRGRLCLFVPARPELQAPIDKAFGHYRRYTKPELEQKLNRAGFEIERLDYFNMLGYFGWWLNFCALKREHFDIGSVTMFDRFLFPVGNAIERHVLRPPFGQSLLAVARAK